MRIFVSAAVKAVLNVLRAVHSMKKAITGSMRNTTKLKIKNHISNLFSNAGIF